MRGVLNKLGLLLVGFRHWLQDTPGQQPADAGGQKDCRAQRNRKAGHHISEDLVLSVNVDENLQVFHLLMVFFDHTVDGPVMVAAIQCHEIQCVQLGGIKGKALIQVPVKISVNI